MPRIVGKARLAGSFLLAEIATGAMSGGGGGGGGGEIRWLLFLLSSGDVGWWIRCVFGLSTDRMILGAC
jgi:hypothetical protein